MLAGHARGREKKKEKASGCWAWLLLDLAACWVYGLFLGPTFVGQKRRRPNGPCEVRMGLGFNKNTKNKTKLIK